MNARTETTNPIEFAKAFSDPTRQLIMQCCCCEWKSVNQLVDAVAVSQPTVSHHLALLRDAGLVQVRHEGKHSYYMLNQDKVAFCCGMLISTFAPDSQTAEQLKVLNNPG